MNRLVELFRYWLDLDYRLSVLEARKEKLAADLAEAKKSEESRVTAIQAELEEIQKVRGQLTVQALEKEREIGIRLGFYDPDQSRSWKPKLSKTWLEEFERRVGVTVAESIHAGHASLASRIKDYARWLAEDRVADTPDVKCIRGKLASLDRRQDGTLSDLNVRTSSSLERELRSVENQIRMDRSRKFRKKSLATKQTLDKIGEQMVERMRGQR